MSPGFISLHRNRVGSIRADDLFKCRAFIQTVTAPSRNRPIYSSNAHTDWNRFAPVGTCQCAENACACVRLTSQFHSVGPTSHTPSQILLYNRRVDDSTIRFCHLLRAILCIKSAFNAMHQFCGAPPIAVDFECNSPTGTVALTTPNKTQRIQWIFRSTWLDSTWSHIPAQWKKRSKISRRPAHTTYHIKKSQRSALEQAKRT